MKMENMIKNYHFPINSPICTHEGVLGKMIKNYHLFPKNMSFPYTQYTQYTSIPTVHTIGGAQ